MKFNLSSITIMLLCVIAVSSSRLKKDTVDEDKYAQNTSESNVIPKIQNKTSIYTGVSWITDCTKWKANLKHNRKQYYGGLFDNEEHAAMKVNLLCDEYGIKRKNLTIDIELDAIQKIQNKTSIYNGVSWNSKSKKWRTDLQNNGKTYYGGLFDNEDYAAMKINLLCDEYGIKRKNPMINIELHVTTPKIQNRTSKYIGVSRRTDVKKWQAQLKHNGKSYYGGLFDNEEHAAMKINLLCDEYGIKRKNSTIDIKSQEIQKTKDKTSNYHGVCWNSNSKKWKTDLQQNRKTYYGGLFDNEDHAAMKINLLCDEYGIKRKNPTIDIELHATAPKIQNKTSIYTGVSWNSDKKKWRADLKYNRKPYYGGLFDNEEHAAMRVNLLCDEHGIIRKNLTIDEETDVIQKKIKSNIDQSKKENIIKIEEGNILYGFKDQCENNFMKSEEKEINNDTAVLSHKIKKRKRTKQLNYK